MLVRINLGFAAVMAGLVLLAAFLGGHRVEMSVYPTPTGELAPAQLGFFYGQKLVWTTCGGSICTWVQAPVNYKDPQGTTIRLRVKLRPADSRKPKGNLFINPGGPGGSGVDYVDGFAGDTSKAVRADYNIIGFDPRGVGRSSPLKCLSDSAFDKYTRIDPTPNDFPEILKLEKGFTSIGKACVKRSGLLASHVSTEENARDLDVLRSLMGSRKLDFYGASYGTQLGATYANLYPTTVGSMVLDGGVDPSLSKERQGFGQAGGFELALKSFLKDCVEKENCSLGKDVDAGELTIRTLLIGLDEKPMKTRGDRKLTENAAIYGIAYSLYTPKAWAVLNTALDRTSFGDGTVLLALADQYFGRNNDGSYDDNSAQVVNAVRCLDYPKSPTRNETLLLLASYLKKSPVFGKVMAWTSTECVNWPVKSKTPQRPVHAKGAPPILVIGTTRDPATPYAWSKSLAKELDSGILITRHGDGHTGYAVGNSCVDGTVNRFLTDGKVPRKNVDCPE